MASCYLILKLDRKGIVYIDRKTTNPPALARNEIAVRITIDIPQSAFASQTIDAEISVSERQIITPKIEVDVEDPPADEDSKS